MNRNTNKIAGYTLALVVLFAGLGLGLGGVAAQMDSPTLVDNQTVTPTNETQSIYLDATGVDDFNGSSAVNVTVTIEGLTENQTVGNGTTLDTSTIAVSEGNVSSYDYTLADADRDYDQLVVNAEVDTDGDESLIASVDWGTLEQVSGGAGLGLGSGTSTGLIVAVVAVIGAALLKRED